MPHDIEDLLDTWARWAAYRADSGLGFSRTTTLGRTIDIGPVAAAIRGNYGPRTIRGNETAERLDRAIAQLPDQLKAVVILAYLSRDSRKQCAAKLSISYWTFWSRLKHAKAILAGRLDLTA